MRGIRLFGGPLLRDVLICAAAGVGVLVAADAVAVAAQTQTDAAAAKAAPEAVYIVEPRRVSDRKSVFATVQSTDAVKARARISGTIAELTVTEGSEVTPGQVIAFVGDEKLGLKLRALEANIKALEAQKLNAQLELERAEKLVKRGVISQARLDALKAAFAVATNRLKSAIAERSVVKEQLSEGAVVAPALGRVLTVPVTTGSVVMPGETIATIAANRYVLRLDVPERHARFMKEGDKILVGSRGLSPEQKPIGTGTIIKVYPELHDGRVVADAEAQNLGTYFVGERALVWISAGERTTFIIPRSYLFKRFSLDYVRLKKKDGGTIDVVVQLGEPATIKEEGDAVEVLAGLAPGDELVKP